MFFVYFAIVFLISTATCETFECSIEADVCEVVGFHQDTTQPKLEFSAPHPEEIKTVSIHESTISTLTADLCTTFPNLETIDIKKAGIKQILPHAFDNCEKLRVLDLNENEIEQLDVAIFSKNAKLEEIYLKNNRLTEFPAAIVKGLSDLNTLNLEGNSLTDLDVVDMYESCPKLGRLSIDKNNFTCHKLDKIVARLIKYSFDTGLAVDLPTFKDHEGKPTIYGAAAMFVHGLQCSYDVDWYTKVPQSSDALKGSKDSSLLVKYLKYEESLADDDVEKPPKGAKRTRLLNIFGLYDTI